MANEHPVMDMLHMYFPDFITEDEDRRERTKRTYPFHHGLSEEEHTQDREAAIQSLQFVQNVALWRRDPEAYCTAVDKNQESSFANLFPPPLPEEKLRTLLGHYLQQIERMQQVLDDIFGDATSVADDIKQE
ncbi:hypothetical protein CERSUDRAFT_95035 [Gelatoporia subvermispora B]|uniref:Uncharacterized protein n=1 Tax=Ceriporiopsis subvermispora (strain B) TaxID=914234 RepID=M2QXA8_CERS8|nr:hypothetical protein CERSUDRAFT_95035 [Gelatoporia subvermispora B]